MGSYFPGRRLWLTADKSRLVEDGDLDAATLFCGPRDGISEADAERFGIKAAPPPEDKAVKAPPEDKAAGSRPRKRRAGSKKRRAGSKKAEAASSEPPPAPESAEGSEPPEDAGQAGEPEG